MKKKIIRYLAEYFVNKLDLKSKTGHPLTLEILEMQYERSEAFLNKTGLWWEYAMFLSKYKTN
jgi:hypothetical protein